MSEVCDDVAQDLSRRTPRGMRAPVRRDRADGDPIPVVFVPGLNSSSSVWRQVVDELPADLATIVVDCPPLDDVDSVAEALLAALPDRFVAVGHSFGGYVALAMLAAQLHRLDALILVSSTDGADSPEQAAARLARVEEARTGDYEAMAMAQVAQTYHPDHVGDPELLAARRAGIREYGVERFVAHSLACASRPDRSALLGATDVPVLVVTGDHDRVVPTALQQAMGERVGAAVVVIDTAGHLVPVEQPKALAQEIAAFVDQLAGRVPSTNRSSV